MTQTKVETKFLGTGAIAQVEQQVYHTFTQIASSSTYTDTGVTDTITPSSSSSKILVMFGLNLGTNQTGGQALQARLLRGSTVIRVVDNIHSSNGSADNANPYIAFLDEPSTASAVTYKVQMHGTSGSIFRINNYNTNANEAYSSMTLLEVL